MSKYDEKIIISPILAPYLEKFDPDDISNTLETYKEIVDIKEQFEKVQQMIEESVKFYMKKRKWKSYQDKNSKVNINIHPEKVTIINKELLNKILTEKQLSQITKIQTKERLVIMTPNHKRRLSKDVAKAKK